MKLSDVFSNYFVVRAQMVELLKKLSPQQYEWTPPNHKSSIRSILTHVAIVEHFFMECVHRGKAVKLDYSKFLEAGTLDEFLPLLEDEHRRFTAYLNEQEIDDWDRVFYEVGPDEKVSKRWLVWNLVEHQARHRGQILMLMRMQGVEFKDV